MLGQLYGAWLASRGERLCELKVSKKCTILGVDEEPKLAEEVCAHLPPADALLPKP
jgi:hypothetical protein